MIVLAACAAMAPASASAPAAGGYLVEVVMRDGGTLVAQPRLTVGRGDQAAFMKSDGARWIKLSALPVSDGRVHVALDSVSGTAGGLSHGGGTAVIAADGRTATLTAATSGAGELRVEVKVRRTGG